MADHAEEQAMEAEALEAIFDTHFCLVESSPLQKWSVEIYPETGDPSELDALNNVACKLVATLPEDYPESLPELTIEIIKGLAEEHAIKLQEMAAEEADANMGVPSIFAIAERLREWLSENNVKGLDDVSMHAQMMRKKKEEEKAKQKVQTDFESQKKSEEMTTAEKEELAVRKRRAEGTPCNKENFLAWKEKFDAEQQAAKLKERQEAASGSSSSKKKDTKAAKAAIDKSGRTTGYSFFAGKLNLDALEAAAEAAENDEMEEEELVGDDVNEELFEEDVDLDDLDFDDEDEEEEEELDI